MIILGSRVPLSDPTALAPPPPSAPGGRICSKGPAPRALPCVRSISLTLWISEGLTQVQS